MTTTKKRIDINALIRNNPKVDSILIAEARAAIKVLRKHGFGHPGYGLANGKGRGLFLRYDTGEPASKNLPDKHR